MVMYKEIAMHKEIVISDLKDLAARLKVTMGKFLKELDVQVEKAQSLHYEAEGTDDPDAELETRIYSNTMQGLQESVHDALHYTKYLLGNIDADGQLELNARGRFYLPAVDERGIRRDTFEFTCGDSIEIFDEQEQQWLYGSVEYADKYEHGYYFKPAGLALQPGMKARHRHVNSWDD